MSRFKYRQFRLSIIVTTQSWNSIPPICRYSATSYIIFRTFNKKQHIAIEEELEGSFPDFNNIYNTATKERHSFLYLDMKNRRACRNVDDLVYDGDASKPEESEE